MDFFEELTGVNWMTSKIGLNSSKISEKIFTAFGYNLSNKLVSGQSQIPVSSNTNSSQKNQP